MAFIMTFYHAETTDSHDYDVAVRIIEYSLLRGSRMTIVRIKDILYFASNYREIHFEEYLQLLRKIEIEEAALKAKRRHTKIRRSHFNSSRSRLVLAMIEAGVPYLCAHDSCEVHADLTIDHITPLSRGSTDDLSNLQFLCLTHNSAKSDKLTHS